MARCTAVIFVDGALLALLPLPRWRPGGGGLDVDDSIAWLSGDRVGGGAGGGKGGGGTILICDALN